MLCFHDLWTWNDAMTLDIGKEKGCPTVLKQGHSNSNTIMVGTAGGRLLIYDIRIGLPL